MSRTRSSLVALVTEDRYTAATAAPGDWYLANLLEEDRLLTASLAGHGLSVERVAWSRHKVDWSRYRAAVLRTTWDYYQRLDEFMGWLSQTAAVTELLNPLPLVRWNLDKHYLADLDAAGVSVVPTRFLERGADVSLAQIFQETGWAEVVLKPAVSACAFETHRVTATHSEPYDLRLRSLVGGRDMMVQPFQTGIVTEGEVAVMVIAGRVTHAVRKRPQAGDFRVQDDHGGTVHEHAAAPEEIALAEAAMAACSPAPCYGRVDMVRGPDGRPRVMELELIEPELWLRHHPSAAMRFAEAVASTVGDGG